MSIVRLILLFTFITISLLSCKKEDIPPPVAINPTTISLFTAKQWIFDSVYNSYTGPGTGSLVYVRGSNNNSQNLDNSRVIYWRDGLEDIFGIYNGYTSTTWSFTGADSTKIHIYPSTLIAEAYQRITKLDATHLDIFDSTNSALDIFIYKP